MAKDSFDISVEDFCKIYPEFKDVDSDSIEALLEINKVYISRPIWGKFTKIGLYAYTAHGLCVRGALNKGSNGETLYNKGGGQQKVASKTAGSISISYASDGVTAATAGDNLHTTSYGCEYLRLKKLVSPIMIISNAKNI